MWDDENSKSAGTFSSVLLVSFITKAKDDAGNEAYVNLGIAPSLQAHALRLAELPLSERTTGANHRR